MAENARLEQDLVVLRQKLQASRRGSEPHRQRSAVALVPDSVSAGTTAALEAELRQVQQLVGDLQRQRQELSIQVRHLTEKSHSLVQQIRPGPTGVAGMLLPASIGTCNLSSVNPVVIVQCVLKVSVLRGWNFATWLIKLFRCDALC